MLSRTIFSALLLPAIIIIEGYISISVEILTIRQLLPVAGSSVIVTSLVIGVFLLFLAVGYQRGGRDYKAPTYTLWKNFLISSIWMGIGLSYVFISLFFSFTEKIIGPHTLYALIIYLLLITAPLIYLLGQTVPITMNMANQNRSTGRIGGNILGLSTIGSFLGAVLTTLVLLYFWGVAATLFFNFVILSALALFLTDETKQFFLSLFIVISSGMFIYNLNVDAEHNMFVMTNNYGNYQILTSENARLNSDEKILRINDSYSSYINNKHKGFRYIEEIKAILFDHLQMQGRDILVLGAGGFSLTAEGTHNNNVTYVDIDPQLEKVVIPAFISQSNGKLVHDDARHFISASRDHYDAIVVDVYSSTKSIPAHLLTKEFMLQVKQRLNKNGVVIINVIANPLFEDKYSKRVDNTIRSIFKNCVNSPLAYSNAPTNLIYVCRNSSNQADNAIYTDNLNNSTVDMFSG